MRTIMMAVLVSAGSGACLDSEPPEPDPEVNLSTQAMMRQPGETIVIHDDRPPTDGWKNLPDRRPSFGDLHGDYNRRHGGGSGDGGSTSYVDPPMEVAPGVTLTHIYISSRFALGFVKVYARLCHTRCAQAFLRPVLLGQYSR